MTARKNKSAYLRSDDLPKLQKIAAKHHFATPSDLLEAIGTGRKSLRGEITKETRYPTSFTMSALAIEGLVAIARSHGISFSRLVRAISDEQLSVIHTSNSSAKKGSTRKSAASDDGDGDKPHPATDTGRAAGGD